MPWQNTPGDGNKNPNKNPWGSNGGSNGGGGNKGGGPRNPWGGNNNGGGDLPPDLDDLLRKAQANLRQAIPGLGRHGPVGGGRMAALIGAGVVAIWLLSGFYIINPGENGVIQRFGRLDRTQMAEGLGYHMPWPVETITTVNVSHMRRMPIGFTEQGGNRDVPEESLMLTSDANIVDLDLVVLWNVKSAEQYLFNIDDPENTIKKVAESAIREVVGQTQMLPIITNGRTQVAEKARAIMQQNLDSYQSGITVAQVLIQQAEVHPDVQEAFQDVQSAKQDAINVQNQAETYRQDILPRARGAAIQRLRNAEAYRDAAVARATGEAKRFNSIYESYQQGRDVTRARLYLETMEDVVGHAQTTILDGKAGGAVLPYLPAITPDQKAAPSAQPATRSAPAPEQKP